jgi:hypothetical protein
MLIKNDESAFYTWINHENTTELLRSDIYVVHVNIVNFATFEVFPFTVRDKFFEAVDSVMGITTEWGDRLTKGLKFKPTTDYESGEKVLK